jgi:hypothetical protein
MILVALCLPVVATAEERVDAITEASSSEVKEGETVTVNLVLPSNVVVKSGAVSFDIDETAFELVRTQWGSSLEEALLISFKDETKQGVFAFTSPTTIGGMVISFDFRTLKQTGVDFVINLQLKDANNQDVAVTVKPVAITVGCNHQYEQDVVPPTCEDDGYTTFTCKLCGDSYTDAIEPALKHIGGEWEVETPAQIGVPGKDVLKCERCGEVIDSRETPALENPDKPIDPDQPGGGDDPIDPDKPINPDQPGGGDDPIDPDKPIDPDNPGGGDDPIKPDDPKDPDETTAADEEEDSDDGAIDITGCVSVSSGDVMCLPIAFIAVFALGRKKRK